MFVQYITYTDGSADLEYGGDRWPDDIPYLYENPNDAYPSDCVMIVPGTEDL